MYYVVTCEAPAGGFGPSAVVRRDPDNPSIRQVDYLDLMFEVWLGGELIQHIGHYCITAALWDHLSKNRVSGVSVRKMSVTPGEMSYCKWTGQALRPAVSFLGSNVRCV